MEFAENSGYTAFIEDTSHPLLAGLDSKDFFTFNNDLSTVYRNAYEKPTRGARSLVQCHTMLRHSALAEIPVGTGLIIPCQLDIGTNIAANPVAQQLLLNMLGYAASYKQEFYPVAAYLEGAPQLKAALDAMGLQYKELGIKSEELGVNFSLLTPNSSLIVNATPAVLKTLADNLAAVKKFTTEGGALILCGVTPEGLADYNKIVGVDHVIRPFGRERVTLPALRSRLTAGLTASDVTLFSSERIFNWTDGNYVASDVFSHVVDYDDLAPFGTSSFGSYKQIVNGFVSADGWPLIINFAINADNSPFQVPITFPKEYTFSEFTWIGNIFYWPQKKINLLFDGDRASMLSFPTAPNAEPHVFAITPPRRAKSVTLEIAEWEPVQGKGALVGIDNISLKVQRPPAFYNTVKPFVNVGGLMEYEMGKGRIVLCNLLFQANEPVPENAAKKRRILSTILHNLKAPFSGGRTVVAGMNLKYTPLDISKSATQFRDDKGWFGDKARTFKDLPTGRQRMAGVPFDIYEMPTSPVPNALMLRGGGVPGNLPVEIKGVPLGIKADALFFLHAARVDRRLNDREKREGKVFELAKYIVHYADGQTVEIPLIAEKDVEHYVQKTPAAIPGSQIAWTKKYDTSDDTAVAYMKQWTNPRPDVAVATIDLLPGKDNAGVPVLLALTAALAE
jgi:beta-galactosidase